MINHILFVVFVKQVQISKQHIAELLQIVPVANQSIIILGLSIGISPLQLNIYTNLYWYYIIVSNKQFIIIAFLMTIGGVS